MTAEQKVGIDINTIKDEEIQNDFDYYMAQRVAEQLKTAGLISIDEFNKLTQLNRRTFLPMNVEILPKIC
ncbi:MAG: SHOCT domain-containing protein [Ruminiclostridium sp.]